MTRIQKEEVGTAWLMELASNQVTASRLEKK